MTTDRNSSTPHHYEQTSPFLIHEPPLEVSPRLAAVVGLKSAIVLQVIRDGMYSALHYRKEHNVEDHRVLEFMRDDGLRLDEAGRAWVKLSIEDWQEKCPFWGPGTVKRTLRKLVKAGVLFAARFPANRFDRSLWYSINGDVLDRLTKGGHHE